MRGLISGALRQRVLVNLLFVLLMLLGWISYRTLPVDSWPEVSLDEAWITTLWDGAGAGDIERLVTRKIEEEIEEVSGIKRIISESQPGISFIDVKFNEDLEVDEYEAALNDLRSAVDRTQDLPEDAETPILQRLTTSEIYPLFSVVVSASDPAIPELTLRETARALRRILMEVPGVQRARYNGYRDRELRVLVDRLEARRYDVSLSEVADALQRTNRSQPAGSLERGLGLTAEVDPQSSEVRLNFDTEYDAPQELESAVVKVLPGRAPLRLEDVATVESGFERRQTMTRINGNPAIVLNVAKERHGDTLTLRDGCGAAIDAFRDIAPVGIEFEIVADQSEVVKSRLKILLDNLFQGLFIVVVILFFSIGVRNAMVALIGLPFSYLCCFLAFGTLDLTINNLTLFGMVLVGGMLVDDAVVVIENIYRHIERGVPLHRAVLDGASEVAWPVITAIMTSMAAMLPLLLQGGVTGRFFSYIPKVVILALAFSLLQCVTVLPVHYLEFGRRPEKDAERGPTRRERFFASLGAIYIRLLGYVLQFRVAFLAVLLGGSLALVGLVLRIPQDPWVSDFNAIFTTLKCDPSFSLEQTAAASRLVEEELAAMYDDGLLKNYYLVAGFSMTSDGVFIRRPDVAFFMSTLVDIPEVTENPERLVNQLRERLDERMRERPDSGVSQVEVFAPHDGPPLGKPVAVRVECNDYLVAKRAAEEIKAELRTVEGVYGVTDNLDLGPREFRFVVDEDKAATLGFFPLDMALALRAANDGFIVGSYKDRKLDEDVDIRVQYALDDRRTPDDLLLADARGGVGLVPLGDVSRVEVWRPNLSYYHYDTQRTVLVTADVDGVVATGPQVNSSLSRRFADLPQRFPGLRVHFGGEFEETQRSMEQQRQSFWVALVLVYVLLAAQFRSYKQPLIVMAVVPFGVLGVLVGLLLRQQPFTIPTFIAMIGLAGVVVNESLVLVVFMNRHRAAGERLAQAILSGARQRLRPVLITAGTTIGNLLPLAFGWGGASRVWTPFAVSVVSGMAVASFTTLFLVPVLYSFSRRPPAAQETEAAPTSAASAAGASSSESSTD